MFTVRKRALQFQSISRSSRAFGLLPTSIAICHTRLLRPTCSSLPTSKMPPKRSRKRTASDVKKETVEPNGQATTSKYFPSYLSSEEDFHSMWEDIVEMRKHRDADVDSMGCEVLADPKAPIEVQRFHVLVALLLSSQTKDPTTAAAVKNLQKNLKGGLTVQSVQKSSVSELDALISKVGFHSKKAQYLKQSAEICIRDHGGDIPNSAESLMKLPGIGPKMAYICMNVAWGECTGLGVDTHVHRISQRLGWVKAVKTPEDTRKQLEEWVPRTAWRDFNLLLVGFGQQICLPRTAQCEKCLLRRRCPSSSSRGDTEREREREREVKGERESGGGKVKRAKKGGEIDIEDMA